MRLVLSHLKYTLGISLLAALTLGGLPSCSSDAGAAESALRGTEAPPRAESTAEVSSVSEALRDRSTRSEFVRVEGTQFFLGKDPYYFVGANFWHAMNLASRGKGGNRAQLLRELDDLAARGIKNLRVIAASEGPDSEPYRVVPALMKSPGVYDQEVLDGLDFLLKAMSDRDMRAVMVLGNMWPWSGGFAQYLVWNKVAKKVPYPPPAPGGDWNVYQDFTAQFYGHKKSVKQYLDHTRFIVSRYNKYTRRRYADEPAIMAWELANEPRALKNVKPYLAFIEESSRAIKQLDKNHLVTVGSEGDTPWPGYTGTELVASHEFDSIDYATAHVWIQNWGWFDPEKPERTYPTAVKNAKDYVKSQVSKAELLGKPLVIEEFGIARDENSYDPSATVWWRDYYFKEINRLMLGFAESSSPLAGFNFWAWAGESSPVQPFGSVWRPGDPMLGDPPHEYQGWYSVYTADTSTLAIFQKYAQRMSALSDPNTPSWAVCDEDAEGVEF
jgi:mannan endo-1,4-beta-mannosidase